jgi:hypothetical protein
MATTTQPPGDGFTQRWHELSDELTRLIEIAEAVPRLDVVEKANAYIAVVAAMYRRDREFYQASGLEQPRPQVGWLKVDFWS